MPIPQLHRRRSWRSGRSENPALKRLRRVNWRRILLRIVLPVCVIGILVVGLGGIAAFAWFSRDLPSAEGVINRSVPLSTRIYDRTGSHLLFEFHGDQRRTPIELAEIPKTIVSATLAAEDHDFYKHPGFDLRGIIRAAFKNLVRGGRGQGGSTITQQFVKNALLTNEKTYTRKIKEVVLSYQLERKFTKDQILNLYFNEIPYGSNAYGIEAASQLYFGKSARDLDLAESALIAAIPQAPTFYSPWGNHQDRLVVRQQGVLDEMVKLGSATQEEVDAAKAVDILTRVKLRREENIQAPHFVFYVRELLAEKYGEREVEQGGLKITTTLDMNLQTIAEEEVKAGAERNETRYRAENAAATAVDPKTGQILAMVGSRDYFDEAHDGEVNVAMSERNPGSSFKPVVYLTAFERGYTPDTILYDLKTNFGPDGSGKNYSPSDYDGKERGPVTMRKALAGSLNIPAVQTLYLAGIDNVIGEAEKLGYTTLTNRDQYGLALALGGGGVRLVEHVGAFATLAADGVRRPLTPILKVQDKGGKVLEEFKQNESRVVDKQVVRQLVSILTDNDSRSFIFGSHSPLILKDRPVAAKTGTTNDWRDGWTMGFTPSLVLGVWTGNNDYGKAMAKGADGVLTAAPIWNKIMTRALAGDKVEQFPKPKAETVDKPILSGKSEAETTISVDAVTGGEIPAECLSSWPPAFVSQQQVREVHSILYYVDRANPRGSPPADPSADPMFQRFEDPVLAWAKKQKFVAKRPAIESCTLRDPANAPVVQFLAPTEGTSVPATSVSVSLEASGVHAVSSIAVTLDDKDVGQLTAAPYTLSVPLETAVTGFHVLKATVTDAIGLTGTATVNLNVVATP